MPAIYLIIIYSHLREVSHAYIYIHWKAKFSPPTYIAIAYLYILLLTITSFCFVLVIIVLIVLLQHSIRTCSVHQIGIYSPGTMTLKSIFMLLNKYLLLSKYIYTGRLSSPHLHIHIAIAYFYILLLTIITSFCFVLVIVLIVQHSIRTSRVHQIGLY